MVIGSLDNDYNFLNFFRVRKYNKKFRKEHPTYFDPEGLLVFCRTSAVQVRHFQQ